MKSSIIYLLVLLSGYAGFAEDGQDAVMVNASVKHVEWSACQPHLWGVKLNVELVFRNVSQEPVTLGEISVANERVWRRSSAGRLELVRETSTPDEFLRPEQYKEMLDAIKEQPLAPHQVVTISYLHQFYLVPQFIQHSGSLKTVLTTFRVANLRRNGSASQYWTQPVTITLPEGCSVN